MQHYGDAKNCYFLLLVFPLVLCLSALRFLLFFPRNYIYKIEGGGVLLEIYPDINIIILIALFQDAEFSVRVSYLELYNEEIFDLLSAADDTTRESINSFL